MGLKKGHMVILAFNQVTIERDQREKPNHTHTQQGKNRDGL